MYIYSNYFFRTVAFARRNSISKLLADKFSYFNIENAYMKPLNNQGHAFFFLEG